VPHNYFSPAFIKYSKIKADTNEVFARIILTAVYYHHNRDFEINANQINDIIDNDLVKHFGKLSKNYHNKILGDNMEDDIWVDYAVILGMLNKLDYYASDIKEKYPFEIYGEYNGKFIGDYVYNFITEKNCLRDVQKYMLENKNENVIITASTGIGKTESALLWADNSKLFYTLPLKVSINAMYERIYSRYGYDKNKITLLHSDCISVISDTEENSDTAMMKYDSSRRLSYPVTICTIDQLFSFVYKYRGSEILLATLKYSKIVIDEIQSYEPKIIAKLIYGLSLITRCGGKFAIITATLPPVIMYFIDEEKIPHKHEKTFLMDSFLRHRICYEQKDKFNYDKIIEYSKSKKVLVICNTVNSAKNVYNELKDKCEYVKLLHAKFMKKHQKLLENDILRFADDKNASGIWISTQIVEASLDIDFDVLFTEMCNADNLLQRMGRCYRKRKYCDNEPNIYITDNRNGYGSVYIQDIYDRSTDSIKQYNGCMFSEQDKLEYINKVYDKEELMKNNSGYFKNIRNEINELKKNNPFNISKKEAKQKLRNIISYKIIPQSEYNKYNNEFQKYYEILKNKKKHSLVEYIGAMEFLEKNSINIGNYDIRQKKKSNSIFSGVDFYTLDYKYDFNEETLCGVGLEDEEDEDLNYI
jgi:CRISPR-associated endonuclease/helicase Cas3